MSLPSTAAHFDGFDWTTRSASLEVSSASVIDDPATGILTSARHQASSAFYQGGYVQCVAFAREFDTEAREASLFVDTSVPDTFTLEFDTVLDFDTLPADFEDTGNRVFVGAASRQGYVLGILISRRGLALASRVDDPSPRILAGSDKLLMDSDGASLGSITVRAVVDGEVGTASIYSAPTKAAYDKKLGEGWADYANLSRWYTTSLPESRLDDGAFVICRAATQEGGSAGETFNRIQLKSFRLAKYSRKPQGAPTAVPTMQRQVRVGAGVTASGASSSDPLERALTYDWELAVKPAGSRSKLRGGTYAVASIGNLQVSFREPTSRGDDWSWVLRSSISTLSLSIDLDEQVVYVDCAMSGDDVLSTEADLLGAVQAANAAGWNKEVASRFTIALSGAGSDVLTLGTYPLAGGAGSTLKAPSFVPDVEGTYILTLRVSNGVRWSDREAVSVRAEATNQLLDHRPDSNYIFSYLSDFWRLVEDRRWLPTFWSSVTQTVADDLLAAWQHDFSKSLDTISARYQRKWRSYLFGQEVSETSTQAFVPAQDYLLTTLDVSVSPTPGSGDFVLKLAKETELPAGMYYARADNGPGQVVEVIEARDGYIFFGGAGVQVQKELHRRNGGQFIGDDETSTRFESPGFDFSACEVGDRVFYKDGATWRVAAVQSTGAGFATLDTAGRTGTGHMEWAHVRPYTKMRIESLPYFELGADVPLPEPGLQIGDIARISLLLPNQAVRTDLWTSVLAQVGRKVFVEWGGVVEALSTLVVDGTVWTVNELRLVDPIITGLYRAGVSDAHADLRSVPRLGTTIASSYQETFDYHVEDGSVKFLPVARGTVVVEAGKASVRWATRPPPVGPLDSPIEPLTITLEEGDAGTYGVVGVAGSAWLLDRAPRLSSSSAVATAHRFSNLRPPPLRLWGEVSFFDNRQTIENNFGVMAGLKVSDFEASEARGDYLTTVRAFSYALVGAPSPASIQAATQVLWDLPYVAKAAVIRDLKEPVGTAPGSIQVDYEDGTSAVFLWPAGATLAVNPTTLRELQFAGVDEADPVRLADATVPANTVLVDVVEVHDFVNNKGLNDLLPAEKLAARRSMFVVELPLDVLKTTQGADLLRSFLNRAKPARTQFVITGSFPLKDAIDVGEDITHRPTLMVKDQIYSPRWIGDPPLWPTGAHVEVGGWSAIDDVHDRFEGGLDAGRLDDWSGDGSLNQNHGIVDMANRIDGPVDVLNSRIWVPITKVTAGDQAGIEFVPGEEVVLWNVDDDAGVESIWDTEPPVVVFIGSGVHPKIPFSVFSPQNAHPSTFLVLGFRRESGRSSGVESRLDAIIDSQGDLEDLALKGVTSGAIGVVDVLIDRSDPTHAKYFDLDYLFRLDKSHLSPEQRAVLSLSYYVPAAGATYLDYRDASASLGAPYQTPEQQPYEFGEAAPDLVPALAPGLPAIGADGDDLKYGYNEANAAQEDPDASALQNVWASRAYWQTPWRFSAGNFVHGLVPEPSISKVTVDGGILRVEGFYFVAEGGDDETNDHETYGGGETTGSWLFLRNVDTEVEIALENVDFEEGTDGGGRTVLGISGATQTSTGHVLTADMPDPLPAGTYEVVLRQYRPYRMESGGDIQLHIDEAVGTFAQAAEGTITVVGGQDDFVEDTTLALDDGHGNTVTLQFTDGAADEGNVPIPITAAGGAPSEQFVLLCGTTFYNHLVDGGPDTDTYVRLTDPSGDSVTFTFAQDDGALTFARNGVGDYWIYSDLANVGGSTWPTAIARAEYIRLTENFILAVEDAFSEGDFTIRAESVAFEAPDYGLLAGGRKSELFARVYTSGPDANSALSYYLAPNQGGSQVAFYVGGASDDTLAGDPDTDGQNVDFYNGSAEQPTTAEDFATAIAAKLGGLAWTVTQDGAVLTIEHNIEGTAGNQTITTDAPAESLTVSGMSGGVD